MKNRWAFSFLWINVAATAVVLIQFAANGIPNIRELLQTLAYALTYANLAGGLAVWVIGGLAERLAVRKAPLVPVVAAGIIVFTAVGCLLAQTLLMELGLMVPRSFWREYLHTLRIAVPLAVVFGLGGMVHGSLRERVHIFEERLHEKEVAEERARKLAAEERLRSLESRIHPHFLFNTLNSISALIAVNPEQAERTVGRLAALLRMTLDTTQQRLISLREELAMVESYLDIERVRFGEKLRGSVRVPAELWDAHVPPMSVQSLVENAVKHGLTARDGGGEIFVSAFSNDGSLHLEVRDTGPGFDLSAIRAGHGLDNLVGRLDALFGAKAGLNVLRRDGESVVEMFLPFV